MLKKFMQSLKKLWQTPNKDQLIDESPVNPYGTFLHGSNTQVTIQSDLSIVVHQFTKGVLVTILQEESRKFSQFFPYVDEEELNDGGEDEEYDGPHNSELDTV